MTERTVNHTITCDDITAVSPSAKITVEMVITLSPDGLKSVNFNQADGTRFYLYQALVDWLNLEFNRDTAKIVPFIKAYISEFIECYPKPTNTINEHHYNGDGSIYSMVTYSATSIHYDRIRRFWSWRASEDKKSKLV